MEEHTSDAPGGSQLLGSFKFYFLSRSLQGGIVHMKWEIMEEKCTKNTIPAPAARSPLTGVGKGIDALPDGRAPTLSHSHSHSRGTEAAKNISGG